MYSICRKCGSPKDRRTCDLCMSYEVLADSSPLAAKAVEMLFVSKLGSFKTFSAMCSAGAKHGNALQREKRDAAMFRAGQKKITDYFK